MAAKKIVLKSKSLGVPAKKRSVPSGVPSRKNATASRPTGTSRKETLSKAQRHALYKEMLAASHLKENGFCYMLSHLRTDQFWYFGGVQRHLPELYAQKPKNVAGYWWRGDTNWKIRNQVLRIAIRASAPALRIGSAAKPVPKGRYPRKAGPVAKRRGTPNKTNKTL